MLIYVSRDIGTGLINGLFTSAQYPGQEALDNQSSEVLIFLENQGLPGNDGLSKAILSCCIAMMQGMPIDTLTKGIIWKYYGPRTSNTLSLSQSVQVMKIKSRILSNQLVITHKYAGSKKNGKLIP